jgi:hypothetical protein
MARTLSFQRIDLLLYAGEPLLLDILWNSKWQHHQAKTLSKTPSEVRIPIRVGMKVLYAVLSSGLVVLPH